ncbi:MAG TPA: hypothetical protein VF490_02780, partial [Chryseosolibacter sp.]
KDLMHFSGDAAPARDPDVVLTIEGNALPPTEVKGWKQSGPTWILNSSTQERAYFSDSTFVTDLFPGKKIFLSGRK